MNRILQALLLLPLFGSVPIVVATAQEGEESQQEVIPAVVIETTTTTVTSPLLPDIMLPSLPDLTGVDFVALARAEHGKCGEWRDLALSIGWPESEWKTLREIMWRESKCIPTAWSGSDAGLMQINQIHTEWAGMMGFEYPDDLFEPGNNLLFAYRLWSTSGWGPWKFSGPIPGDASPAT